MHRLFIGIEPPPSISDTILALMGGVTNARWQNRAQLHITLRYVGEVNRHMANDLAATLSALHSDSLSFRLDGVGQFEDVGSPIALWAGISPVGPLTELHKKVDRCCQTIGLNAESRAYLPHITIARLNKSSGSTNSFLEENANLISAETSVDQFCLYESILGKSGATYNVIQRYPLRNDFKTF